MFLLDTNVISELRRPRPHGAVVSWFDTVELSSTAVAAATIGEVQRGIERTRDNDPAKALEIEGWLEDFLYRMPVLPMDAETFRIWARLMHKRPPQLFEDAMIAATSLRHGMTVATRNTRHFETFGVQLVNPFAPT
jgi:predicted nucleic acid-binding protein